MTILSLQLQHGPHHVADLSFEPETGTWGLAYSESWRSNKDAFMLTPKLPLDRGAKFSSETIKRYVNNLFPEGRAFDIAVEQLRISKTNSFALLAEFGRDMAGAVEFVDPASTVPAAQPMREVSYAELAGRIKTQDTDGLATWDQKVRLSVAGFQNKLLIFTPDPVSSWPIEDARPPLYLVEPPLASTVILKPEPLEIPYLGANEHFCMSLAKALGFPVADVALLRVPTPVLAVQRFDRNHVSSTQVSKVQVIDACQAMDYSVDFKYEHYLGPRRPEYRDGMSLPKLFGISTQAGSASTKSRLELMQWVIFQLLIGNSDAHGKNFSFFVGHSVLRPAPWYDLVSIAAYANTLPKLDQEFAMAIGDCFTWNALTPYELAYFMHLCNIPQAVLMRELLRIQKQLPIVLGKLLKGPYVGGELDLVRDIAQLAQDRCTALVHKADQAKTFGPEHF
ncbi:HipA domain-containing protein [Comamonas thiooxydans]|uniref:HipA domain-containing protein n=1 Tax=Comamonas thiooxydans TaxID=363952 RepID=UPI000B419446|nr:HipA domain-containing protein [Comamonas thiooxydans]